MQTSRAHHAHVVDDPAELIRGAGLRVTSPRVAVLAEVRAAPHADVDALTRAARARLGRVSTQAVYDVLRVLVDRGLVRRIEPAGSPARYEPETGDNHHHVVCRSCGVIDDVDCAVGAAPCLDAADDRGFVIDEAEVVYWGQCPACAARTANHTDVHTDIHTDIHTDTDTNADTAIDARSAP